MCRAFLDYARLTAGAASDTGVVANTSLMGAFTTQPAVVQQLYRTGIPVWHVRPHVRDAVSNAAVIVMCLPPDSVIVAPLQSGMPPVYSGLTGKNHLYAVGRCAGVYLDISQAPILTQYDSDSFQIGRPDDPSLCQAVTPSMNTSRSSNSHSLRRAGGGGGTTFPGL